jgi:hypothetical protein
MAARKKTKAKKIGTLAAIGAGLRGLAEMRARGVKTPGQKTAAARVKKRVTGVPKVTRHRMKKAGNP